MAFSTTPRIIIAGTQSGVGKSLITLGLVHELRRRGVSVSCGVVGPQLVQSVLLKRLSGRGVRYFDDRLLTVQQNLTAFSHASMGADIVVIDGHGGLYDGYAPGTLRGSDAEIAKLLKAPVALVVDTTGLATSLVAIAKGYMGLGEGVDFAGLLLNRVEEAPANSEVPFDIRDKDYYDAALECFKIAPSLGALTQLTIESKLPQEDILQEKNQLALPRQFFVDIGAAVHKHINIDALLERAALAPPLSLPDFDSPPSGRRVRIAVSDDSCFHLCFQDNLDLLRYYGAELVPFSPLADSVLPKRIGAVYLSGAYMKEYGADIARNEAMKESIRAFIERGGVVYAEGAGAAYLCKDLRISGTPQHYAGVGTVAVRAKSSDYQPRYADIITLDDTILGRKGLLIKGIVTGEWEYDSGDESTLYRSLRFSLPGGGILTEGYSPQPHVLATFAFINFASCPEIAQSFVEAAEVVEPLSSNKNQ